MSTRDLDEAVARLRAASLRNEPLARDPAIDESAADLGPPRGRPDGAGQPAIDPDITEARAQIGQGPMVRLDSMPVGAVVPPPRREPTFDGSRYDDTQSRHVADYAAAPGAEPYDAPQVGADRRRHFGLREDIAFTEGEPAETRGEKARRLASAFWGSALATISARRAAFAARREAARAEKAATVEADARDAVDPADGYEVHDDARIAPAPRHKPRHAPLTERERRWQRRRRRFFMEEILGWILVPIILIALYFGATGLLTAFGYTIDDVIEAFRTLMNAIG